MIDYKSAGLTEEDLKNMYKWMDLGRKLDERLWLLNRAGKIPFVVSGQGQEATQIGMAYAMQKGDISSPYYRDLAFVTYMGISPLDTMLSAFGKRDDINSGGKQMPSHFSHKEKGILSLLNFLPEGCRTIFNLFAMEGYPHKEIAQMLSISEGTSKSQVNFARKKLQELMKLQTINS